jgi:hypothetical protein
MAERENRLLQTVTVIRSQVSMTAMGATTLILETRELGPIAFVLTLERIEILRGNLAKAEALLRQPQGHA